MFLDELVRKFHSNLIWKNDPVAGIFMDLSLIDILGLLQSIGKRDYVKYLVYLSEVSHREMVQLSDELGKNITTQTAIVI